MTRSLVTIDFQMPNLSAKFRGKLREVYLFIAAQIQTNRGMMFDKEGAHNGHRKWAPLIFRSGQILSNRGTLRKSIAPIPARGQPGNDGIVQVSGEKVTVGTKIFYARMMNDGTTKMPGGVLRATKAKALKIPLPSGKKATPAAKEARKTARGEGKDKFIFRKSVKIPARPFDEWNADDQAELDEALEAKLAEVIG